MGDCGCEVSADVKERDQHPGDNGLEHHSVENEVILGEVLSQSAGAVVIVAIGIGIVGLRIQL